MYNSDEKCPGPFTVCNKLMGNVLVHFTQGFTFFNVIALLPLLLTWLNVPDDVGSLKSATVDIAVRRGDAI